jgi:E3 ubiquitin-protein ligase XIAP
MNHNESTCIYPCYSTYEQRLCTFTEWPISLKMRPADLSRAGFFYTGIGDRTQCFFCGLGLKDWKDDDDAWREHVRWSPKCFFIRLAKGVNFVEQVAVSDDNTQESTEEIKKEEPEEENKEKEANTSTESRLLCKICFNNEIDVCFFPCSHIATCFDCSFALQVCPICMKSFTKVCKVYIS